MILIGSEAAKRIGCLPDWRINEPYDIDLVGSRTEFWDLVSKLKSQYSVVVAIDRGNNRLAIRVPLENGSRILIDYITTDIPTSVLIDQLPDNTADELFGIPIKVISELTQLVLKKAYEPFPVSREKNDADIAYWTSRIGDVVWPIEHQTLHDAMRAGYMDNGA